MFKKIVEIVEVPATPAETHEFEQYQCTECEFKTEFESEIPPHFASNHTSTKVRSVTSSEFRYFTDKEKFRIFLIHFESDMVDRWGGVWAGEGWYQVQTQYEPCGRGCCERCVGYLIHIGTVLQRMSADIQKLHEKYSQIDSLSKE